MGKSSNHAPDDNDLLRSGKLGRDPKADAVPFSGVRPKPISWRDALKYTGRGKRRRLASVTANATTILTHDDPWRGVFVWDDFSQTVITTTPPPWDGDDAPSSVALGEWSDDDTARAQAYLMRRHDLKLDRGDVAAAVSLVAHKRVVHPVRQWLSGLEWDRQKRVDAWLSTYLGVESTDYAQLVGRCFLISAVARIYRPGCKVDTMPVLEGPQGRGKSTLLRALVGDEWFADTPLDLDSKDRFLNLRGTWIYEMAELDSLNRSDVNRVKSFLSSLSDKYRPPYGRGVVSVMRQVVFCGTVNGSRYLRDATGNRRFWPVSCGKIDVDAIARDREQIWAEARQLFESGARWWPTGDEVDLCAVEQESRLVADAWQERIDDWLRRRSPEASVQIGEVLQDALGLEPGRWSQADQNRVAACLQAASWVRKQKRDTGKEKNRRTWVYVRDDSTVTSCHQSRHQSALRLVTAEGESSRGLL